MALELRDSFPVGASHRRDIYSGAARTTLNSTPVIAESIPIPQNKSYLITVTVNCTRSDFTSSNSGSVTASFIRAAGNVSRDGTQSKVQMGGLSGASLNLNANTGTQTADIEISGTSASILWGFEITILYNV